MNALVVSHLSDLVHLSTGRTPWVVRRRIPDLCLYYQLSTHTHTGRVADLSIRVAFSVVLGYS
jgi:hypothetical protein